LPREFKASLSRLFVVIIYFERNRFTKILGHRRARGVDFRLGFVPLRRGVPGWFITTVLGVIDERPLTNPNREPISDAGVPAGGITDVRMSFCGAKSVAGFHPQNDTSPRRESERPFQLERGTGPLISIIEARAGRLRAMQQQGRSKVTPGPHAYAVAFKKALTNFRQADHRNYDHELFWAPYILYGLG
jgi:hypothetical protein